MTWLDKVQLFINRYYKVLRLVLLGIIAGLVILLVVNQFNDDKRDDLQRDEAVKDAVSQVIEENQEQTEDIERQFQALCIILVQTSGNEGLQQLDPPLEERCRNLASKSSEQRSATPPSQTSREPRSSSQTPNDRPDRRTAPTRPDNGPEQSEQPEPEPYSGRELLRNLIELPFDVTDGVL